MKWQERRDSYVLRYEGRTVARVAFDPLKEGFVWSAPETRPSRPVGCLNAARAEARRHVEYVFKIVDRAIERSNSQS
jgi:hypothetical protein